MSDEYSTIISSTETAEDLTFSSAQERVSSSSTPTQEIDFLEWTLIEIENWLNELQFDYDIIRKFTHNNITGDILPYLTDEHLKEMEIDVRDRIKLKIEINRLAATKGILSPNQMDNLTNVLTNINNLIQLNVEQSSKVLFDELSKIKEDLIKTQHHKPLPTPEKNTTLSPFNLASPTKQPSSKHPSSTASAPATSPKEFSHPVSLNRKPSDSQRNSTYFNQQPLSASSSSHQSITPSGSSTILQGPGHSPTTPSTLSNLHPVSEPLKQLRASSDDPCSKILQAAMKRHKLNDNWRNYALVICYGDQERILELNEKPVLIFKELKEKGEHPAIMLRQKADFNGVVSGTPGGKL